LGSDRLLGSNIPGELEWKNVETYVLEKNIQDLQYSFSSS